MNITYLSDQDLAVRWGIARPTVWRWHRENLSFPRCVKLTPGCSRWKLSDIEQWEASRATT
ncbi:helix-turn-helix transcriptional regulator [Roseibium alexandrii]|uniref:Putative transcriptional regulator n=1 Tax=Roseibium alexandrii (strain DSM 17067 / NCIMB 14079 / DFL-11) TaxID=244592 RepID=A0A5E8UWI9_ROSAD|nr:putative transcriptional regulator [Roseibium alexandrii DFL-11]